MAENLMLGSDINVRAAVKSDAARLAEIAAATFPLACPPSTLRADLESHIVTELSEPRFEEHIGCHTKRLFAATVEDSVVGYLMLCRESSPAELVAESPLELRRLYVLPQHHGTGVAFSLLTCALREAASGANDVLWLTVSVQNHRGVAFYRKHGFGVIGEQQFKVGSDLHQDFIMSKPVELQQRVESNSALAALPPHG